MLQPLFSVALFTVAAATVEALQQSVPESTCVELVAAAKDQSEREATFGVYTRCRSHGLRGSILEPRCRELARMYSVARHYKDATGSKLAAEEFCATAVGSALEEGPMQEIDACVAGAEEVLSSSEVSEAAETACRRAHPKAAQAPEACRMYVASLAEALHRTPAGELVDAESICGKLVQHPAAPARPVVAETAANDHDPEERKFVSSCVQFAGNLMNNPGVGEAQVRKSCEAHLSSQEKDFCDGYARLVQQKADASDFSNFCVAEYRRMSITAKTVSGAADHSLQPKKAAPTAMNMPALCTRLYGQVVSASEPELRRAASDLCTQELNSLAVRPPAARIRVGCKFFAGRLVKMKEQQGAGTSAEAFCAHMAVPTRAHQPTAAAAPPSHAPQTVVAKVVPIQAHEPASLIAPTPAVAKPAPQAPEPAPVQAPQPAPVEAPEQTPVQKAEMSAPINLLAPNGFISAPAAPLPVVSASAALPALAAAATVVVPAPPGPEDAAKTKSDEDFLSKFLNKYEASTSNAAQPPAVKVNTAAPAQPQMKVFRDDEMADVRRKAEQLFGSDVDPAEQTGGAAAPAAIPSAPAVTEPAAAKPVAVQPPAPVAAVPVTPPQPAAVPATVPAPAAKVAPAASSKKTSLLQGNQDASDFLTSFLTAYTGDGDAPKAVAQSPPAAPTPTAAPMPVATPPAAPVALLESPAALAPSGGAADVDSLVSAFLARSGN